MSPAERARLTDWLALTGAPGLGARTLAALFERFGDATAVRAARSAALREAGLSVATIAAIAGPDPERINAALAWAEQPAALILTRDDPRYPPLLAAIDDPPPILYVRGDPLLLTEPQVAVVGSRNPTPGGVETTRDFARDLAGLGIVITSGLAAGIDRAAHEGALAAGRTIAVLGTGPDRVYPAAHLELARRIGANGALVTEFPPGTGPHPSHFPRRNRLISGLSLGVLVTEAAPRSGSLITARLASEQGREVFAIPGSIHNPLARGCHALIRQGAKLVDSVDLLLEELAPQLQRFTVRTPTPQPGDSPGGRPTDAGFEVGELSFAATAAASVPAAADDGLDADYRRLLDSLGHDPVAPDQLCQRTGLSAQSVSSMLLLLELQGYVSSLPGGRFSRNVRS